MATVKVYTVRELYQYLNRCISVATIYNLIKSGKIPTIRIDRKIFIPASWVENIDTSSLVGK